MKSVCKTNKVNGSTVKRTTVKTPSRVYGIRQTQCSNNSQMPNRKLLWPMSDTIVYHPLLAATFNDSRAIETKEEDKKQQQNANKFNKNKILCLCDSQCNKRAHISTALHRSLFDAKHN